MAQAWECACLLWRFLRPKQSFGLRGGLAHKTVLDSVQVEVCEVEVSEVKVAVVVRVVVMEKVVVVVRELDDVAVLLVELVVTVWVFVFVWLVVEEMVSVLLEEVLEVLVSVSALEVLVVVLKVLLVLVSVAEVLVDDPVAGATADYGLRQGCHVLPAQVDSASKDEKTQPTVFCFPTRLTYSLRSWCSWRLR